MPVKNMFRFLKKSLSPARSRPERSSFSMGERPASGEQPETPSDHPKAGGTELSQHLSENLKTLKQTFHLPESSDVVFREFTCGSPPVKVALANIEGLSKSDEVFQSILQPLMLLSTMSKHEKQQPIKYLKDSLLPNAQVAEMNTLEEVVKSMVEGDSILIVDGSPTALMIETKGWEHRQVDQAVSERIVRGPQHGFVEVLRTNTGLIRSILQTPDLVVESLEVGVRVKTKCALMYVKGLVNPKIVKEIRRRVTGIDTSEILSSGLLEQYIETHHSLLPTIMGTERPDRVANFLMQGMCAVFVSGDPFAIIMPVTFSQFIHSPEDDYIRWPYGYFLKAIRYFALVLTVFFPGLYVATVNYHPEMIPPTLITAIAASRENIPFPLSVELLLMYVGFELIREAGIRIPSPIGPTIGIVGALLIGEAAVSASVVSPIMVIIIAVTGVASFTLPNLEIAMFTRIATLTFIIMGSLFGLFGIVATAYVMFSQAFSLYSFGVPYFSTVENANLRSLLLSPAIDEKRPDYVRPLDPTRQGTPVRVWDAGLTLESQEIQKQKEGQNRDKKKARARKPDRKNRKRPGE